MKGGGAILKCAQINLLHIHGYTLFHYFQYALPLLLLYFFFFFFFFLFFLSSFLSFFSFSLFFPTSLRSRGELMAYPVDSVPFPANFFQLDGKLCICLAISISLLMNPRRTLFQTYYKKSVHRENGTEKGTRKSNAHESPWRLHREEQAVPKATVCGHLCGCYPPHSCNTRVKGNTVSAGHCTGRYETHNINMLDN